MKQKKFSLTKQARERLSKSFKVTTSFNATAGCGEVSSGAYSVYVDEKLVAMFPATKDQNGNVRISSDVTTYDIMIDGVTGSVIGAVTEG
jgi:hypothetical protein